MAIPLPAPRSHSPQTRLLDKYVLPKVALTVITIASLLGTWLTMQTHGAGSWTAVIPRWLHLATFGLLAGGYMWKALFVRGATDDMKPRAAVRTFTTEQFNRFRLLSRLALPLLLATALVDVIRFAQWGVGWLIWAELALLALLALTIGWDAYARCESQQPLGERPLAALALALLLLNALVQASFDVFLSHGGQVGPLLVRWLHLSAFGLWLGGAVWNIFIAVPAAREVVSIPVVIAAGQQVQRFRIAVRLILPTLILTGFIQAYRFTGLNITALWSSPLGLLILAKILLVLALIVIFLTCPLWRACSPIAGMCKLEDLQQPAQPPAPADAHT